MLISTFDSYIMPDIGAVLFLSSNSCHLSSFRYILQRKAVDYRIQSLRLTVKTRGSRLEGYEYTSANIYHSVLGHGRVPGGFRLESFRDLFVVVRCIPICRGIF